MKRLTIAACSCWFGLAGVALAQPLPGTGLDGAKSPVKSVAAPTWDVEALPPPPIVPPAGSQAAAATVLTGSPGSPGVPYSRETRAHELHLMQELATADAIHQAARDRAAQRTRRLESQRWFGVSNTRPACNVDPFDGDYSAYWASNYPFYPMRWLGGGEPWGFAGGQ